MYINSTMVLMKFRKGFKGLARRIAVSPRTGTLRLRTGRGRYIRATRYTHSPKPELKFSVNVGPISDYNAAATVFGDIIRTIPTVSQGDSSQNRDGRKITLYSHTMRGTIRVTSNSAPPRWAYIWMVEDKWMKDFSSVDAAEAFNVYLDEGGQAFSPLGSWSEQGYPMNRDRFIIKKKRVKLSYNAAPANTSGAIVDPTMPTMASFTFTRKFRRGRVLTYASPTATLPENYNSYMFISVQAFDEASGSLTSTTVRAQVTSMFKFKD